MDIGTISEARAQYTDLKGTIAIDFPAAGNGFEDYIESIGIDSKKYHPMGIDIFCNNIGTVSFNVLCIEKDKFPLPENEQFAVTAIKVEETLQKFLSRLNIVRIVLHKKHDKAMDLRVEEIISLS